MSEPTTIHPERQPEDSGFVIALLIGSFSIRLVFARRQARPSRKQRRAQDQAKAQAEAARWAEVNRLLAAQMLLDHAKGRAA